DIDVVVSRIPFEGVVVVGGGPDPDEIVEAVVAGEPVEHQPVERLGGFGAAGAPPEPAALGLVQRTPEHGHSGVAQAGELSGDAIEVADDGGVFGGAFVGDATDVEGGFVGRKTAPHRIGAA